MILLNYFKEHLPLTAYEILRPNKLTPLLGTSLFAFSVAKKNFRHLTAAQILGVTILEGSIV